MSGKREKQGRKCLETGNYNDITWKTRHRWDDNIKIDFTEIGLRECGLDSSVSKYSFREHDNGHSGNRERVELGNLGTIFFLRWAVFRGVRQL